MIKVLVVEDDKFARQGIINSMPWEAHHMAVVGEASNAKIALEILEETQVDLILSDYSMPGMNGLELLKAVKEKYPQIAFGLLTLYESFDIVQQALRYGAVDYISKLRLEEENYNQVLDNLENLVRKEKENRENYQKAKSVIVCPENSCYIFSCMSHQGIELVTDRYPDFFYQKPIEVSANIFLYYLTETQGRREEEIGAFATLRHPWYAMKINGLQNIEQGEFFHILRRYYRYRMFYYHDCTEITADGLEEIVTDIKSISEESIVQLQKRWLETDWLYSGSLFREMLEELKQQTLPFNVLFKLLVKIEDSVIQRYNTIFDGDKIRLPYTFYSWEEVSDWLRGIFEHVEESIKARQLTADVMESITKALRIIHDEISEPLLVADVAERVNMSRSYFSLCFKKVTDASFNQYVRDKKIEIAKYYLEKTDLPIQQIADKAGYEDEKYFSKVFKQEIGVLPTRYRKEKKNSSSTII